MHFSAGIGFFGAFCSNFVGTGREKCTLRSALTIGDFNHDAAPHDRDSMVRNERSNRRHKALRLV